jgi:hypothetical protein
MNIYPVLSMASKTLSIGMVIGAILAATFAFVTLFSNETATAQVMQHQQQMQQPPISDHQQHRMHHSMFNANGMSMVQDVRISGVSITGDNSVSANLTYTGNGTSPSVTVVAITNHEAMRNMMMGGGMMGGGQMDMGMMNQGMMDMGGMNNTGRMMGGGGGEQMGGGMMDMGTRNQTGMMMGTDSSMMMGGTPSDMMMSMAGSQTGSAVLNSGWQSGTTISVMLQGEGSAHDASEIHVMVFPHLT